MLQEIAELIDFDPKVFIEQQIVEDFNHKFQNSILKIDGKHHIISILEKNAGKLVLLTLDAYGDAHTVKHINRIERVLPQTGLYSSNKGLLYLYRLPKRQWIKSLSINNNYKTFILNHGDQGEAPDIWDTVLIDNPTYAKETLIYKNNVYLHWKKVGKIQDSKIYVTNKNFFEEIKELWKPYPIILGAVPQLQKEEKLVLDF